MKKLRIGTRQSKLALWQAGFVRDRLRAIHADLEVLLEPSTFVGRAPEQVARFLSDEVAPALAALDSVSASPVELQV